MIGLDTNVLVRYIAQDDPEQAAQANALVEALTAESPGFAALVSVAEIAWVLKSCYDVQPGQLADVLEGLLRTRELVVERAETVWQAVHLWRERSADFADCLIERSAAAAGCTQTMTFDQAAARRCGTVLIR